eukprot:NODE_12442_length_1224_cov_5.144941.p1 GENE.NODE_12442_length_1224_cov_5.144941~~NODE_12442_length_1224_cov_5.144941.p1  ORF type:complete len:310 (-),score=79.12 NODE_12442_length_1224_cov_5.144941:295-1224(-)
MFIRDRYMGKGEREAHEPPPPRAARPPATPRDTGSAQGSARPPRAPQQSAIAPESAAGDDDGLASAAASGLVEECRRIIERGRTDPNAHGPDGTTPLCAAAMWGHADVVKVLLKAAADPAQPNRTGARPTALHAAALQEHGKICMLLLASHADPHLADGCGVLPKDYASCSEALWPHFEAAGCKRSGKEDLITKSVIRKVSKTLEEELGGAAAAGADAGSAGTGRGLLPDFSRPGSSYVITAHHPPRPGSAGGPRPSSATCRPSSARLGASSRPSSVGRSRVEPIDVLSGGDDDRAKSTDSSGLKSLGL